MSEDSIEPVTVTITLTGEDADFIRAAAAMSGVGDDTTAVGRCVQATRLRMRLKMEDHAREYLDALVPHFSRLAGRYLTQELPFTFKPPAEAPTLPWCEDGLPGEPVGATLGCDRKGHGTGNNRINAFTTSEGGWEIASGASTDVEARREVEVAIAVIEAHRARKRGL